ncbi:hypothetical protein J6W34_03585 [bacterium]|nr:hypothetical protein [bacterium]
MANLKQQLLSKISSMKTACSTACASCTQQTGGVSNSRTAYNNSFSHLTSAINNYFSNPYPTYWGSGNWNKYQQNMYDIITFDFIREMTKDFVYNPPYQGYPTTDLPVGEDDYWKLFGISTFATTFLTRDDRYYFNASGCIYSGDSVTSIENDVTMINETLQTNDLQLQNALVSWLKYYPQKDQLINVTEDMQIVGNPPTISKSQIGTKIYITKNAKDIIDCFGFDIYIPTYVRGS